MAAVWQLFFIWAFFVRLVSLSLLLLTIVIKKRIGSNCLIPLKDPSAGETARRLAKTHGAETKSQVLHSGKMTTDRKSSFVSLQRLFEGSVKAQC